MDPTFYILKALSWAGLVWGMKAPSEMVLRNEQPLGSRVIDRAARQLAASFNTEWIAGTVAARLESATLTALQQRLASAHDRAAEILANAHVPHLPTRAEIGARARAMFVRTRSFDDIVERAYDLVLDAVGSRLRDIPTPA